MGDKCDHWHNLWCECDVFIGHQHGYTDIRRHRSGPSSPAMDNRNCPGKICFVIILFNI